MANEPKSNCFVPYYRVSTDKQEISGLGLDAQKESVRRFIGTGKIIGEFVEVESGKNANRPKLVEAMALARKNKAILVIAKLDRLSRNVFFISGLMESGVEFVAADNPTANRLTIHILAAVAENEARMISERTKNALRALKERGLPLGSARTKESLEAAAAKGLMVRADGRPRSMNVSTHKCLGALERGRKTFWNNHMEALRKEYGALLEDIERRSKSGHSTCRLAAWLNQNGRKTLQGCKWNPKSVWRVLRTLENQRRRLSLSGCAT